MARYKTDRNHPNVIGVWGADVVHYDGTRDRNYLKRTGLKNALFSSNNPLGNLKGKIDFIVCFVINGEGGDHSYVDENLTPRPLRGIIQLAYTLDSNSVWHWGSLISGGVAHEVGHYWLVPGKARIKTDSGEVETPTKDDVYTALHQGLPLPPYPIMARQDAHWSPYIDGNDSTMDAVNHSRYVKTHGFGYFGRSGKYSQTQSLDTVGPDVNVPGLGVVTTQGRYSLLERWMMGDYKEAPHTNRRPSKYHSISILEPKWTFPVDLQAGLYAELSDGSRWYAGFTDGPHRIAAQRAGDDVNGEIVELPFTPYDPYNKIGVRLVQIEEDVVFQARVWAPVIVQKLGSNKFWRKPQTPTNQSIMGDLPAGSMLPGDDAYEGWLTLDTVSGVRVKKMGLSLRTTGRPAYGLLSASLCVFKDGQASPVSLFDLQEALPKAGPKRLYSGHLMMPYVVKENGRNTAMLYEETEHLQDAPKYTMAPPNKDFAFGGTINLESCQQVLWAGRAAGNRTMIGKARRLRFDDVVLPWTEQQRKIKQAEPLNDAYKVLFCVAAKDDHIVAPHMLERLDMMRIAFENYFAEVTRRKIDSAVY